MSGGFPIEGKSQYKAEIYRIGKSNYVIVPEEEEILLAKAVRCDNDWCWVSFENIAITKPDMRRIRVFTQNGTEIIYWVLPEWKVEEIIAVVEDFIQIAKQYGVSKDKISEILNKWLRHYAKFNLVRLYIQEKWGL